MAEQILQVEHLEKYYQKKHVLHDINFHVDKGEVVTLLGPSGSGKSTLIRCLNGLEEYRQGTITFEGKQINTTEKNWQQIRQKIGMVFQSYDLFPNLTVMDNILLGPTKVQKQDKFAAKGRSGVVGTSRSRGLCQRISPATVRRPKTAGGDCSRPGPAS